jgi:hypothetical protein
VAGDNESADDEDTELGADQLLIPVLKLCQKGMQIK